MPVTHAFVDAITKGDYKTVERLLLNSRGPKPSVNCVYERKKTLLHQACLAGDHKIAQLLIINNANINQVNVMGRTPLHLICETEPSNIDSMLESENHCDCTCHDYGKCSGWATLRV